MIDLPPSNTARWSPKRKASVVFAIREGRLSVENAVKRYAHLSKEEINEWMMKAESFGVKGLRTTVRYSFLSQEAETAPLVAQ